MEKKDIRTYVIQKRREIPEEIRMAKSLEITRRIMETQAFSKAEAVYVYMDCKGEVSTKALIEACFSLGKKVAAPKVSGETMDFFWIHSLEDVAPGYFQVPEPTTGEAADAEDALLIVPGVGFDRQRNRCGYGKGFYDRYLSLHSRHTTIGAVGERAGNAPYEDVVLSLLTLYGVDLGLDYSQIYPLSKMLREFSGLQFRGNRGITGDTVFDIESGIVADWYMKSHDSDPLITNSYLPALTGHPDAKIVLGKHSGISSVDCYLAARKLDLTKEQKRLLVDAVKESAYEKHGLLNDADFDELTAKICG